jgi:hypothetical protein
VITYESQLVPATSRTDQLSRVFADTRSHDRSVQGRVALGKILLCRMSQLRGRWLDYILIYMKKVLIEIDDRCARDLERIAPAAERLRAEFIRRAIQRAVDIALDRVTEEAYRRHPLDGEVTAADLVGWDDRNQLRQPGAPQGAKAKAARRKPAKVVTSSPRTGRRAA